MTTRLFLCLASLVFGATLSGCVPPRAEVSPVPSPGPATPEPASIAPTDEPASSYGPPVQSVEPPVEESLATYAVTKPEIRDRAFDWDLQMWPAFDAYDAATTTSSLRAAGRHILNGCKDQQRWLVGHTDYDPQYDEPMTMWADVVDGLCSGGADVVRGVDRGDQTLTRKGKRAIKSARDTMSSSDYLGAWGPLLIH